MKTLEIRKSAAIKNFNDAKACKDYDMKRTHVELSATILDKNADKKALKYLRFCDIYEIIERMFEGVTFQDSLNRVFEKDFQESESPSWENMDQELKELYYYYNGSIVL